MALNVRLMIVLCTVAALTVNAAVADSAPQLTLKVTAEGGKVADALKVLQKECGFTMVIDSTVIGHISQSMVAFDTMPEMIKFLSTFEHGLTCSRLYLPATRPTPTPEQCYDIVRTMEWLGQQGNMTLIQAGSAVTVGQTATLPAKPAAGQVEVWYVSDEAVRAQRIVDQQNYDKQRQQQANQINQQSQSQTNQPGSQIGPPIKAKNPLVRGSIYPSVSPAD